MNFFYRSITAIVDGVYFLIQILPNSLLSRISYALPKWQDVFVPASFFEPRVQIPMRIPVPSNYLDNFDLPTIILAKQVRVRGRVAVVEHRPTNASWNHETFGIVPDNSFIMNKLNPSVERFSSYVDINDIDRGKQYIECESVVGSKLPSIGDRVEIDGTLIIDIANGWTEIHPFTKWRKI